MKVIGINAGPRKGWNTDLLLQSALEGSASKGADCELIHLYGISFKGCRSCLLCKRKEGGSLGRCVIQDDLLPILNKIGRSDAIALGSPIYFGEVTGVMRMFLERLLFQYISYNKDRAVLTPKAIKSLFIYTMNVGESALEEFGYAQKFESYKSLLARVLGPSEFIASTETWQIEDYSKHHMSMFDEAQRRQRRKEVFPEDLRKSFDLGASLVSN
ncbi:MAG: flavodoxin family protein [Clostridiales bacterium]|jgi:multimeric flavodoxin WrbA|nr:flavodoxin family protein [Clostridiales bacterium]